MQKIDPLEVPSRRFTNLVLYKLQEGLDEDSQVKLNTELERTARKIQHPLAVMEIDPAPIVKKRNQQQAVSGPTKRERTPPPGWLPEDQAFKNAMMVMNFNGKGRR